MGRAPHNELQRRVKRLVAIDIFGNASPTVDNIPRFASELARRPAAEDRMGPAFGRPSCLPANLLHDSRKHAVRPKAADAARRDAETLYSPFGVIRKHGHVVAP